MEWTRSETLALAKHNCTHWHGPGLRLSRTKSLAPCNGVLRAIFRICYDRFVRCARQEPHLSRISVEPQGGKQPLPGEERTKNSLRIFAWWRAERSAIPSIGSSDTIFFWAPTGSYAPGSSASTGARSSTQSSGLSKSLGAFFGNWSRMACSRWTNTFMGRHAWEWRRIPRLAVPDPPFSPKGSDFRP